MRQFTLALARQGAYCTVIAPVNPLAPRNWPMYPRQATEPGMSDRVGIRWPRFLSFSSRRVLGTNTALLTQYAFNRCIASTVRTLPAMPDVFYGHFLYAAGRAAVAMGDRFGRPSVVAVGEGEFWSVRPFGFARARRDFTDASGFIAVSSVLREDLIRDLGIPDEKIIVLPNGVDLKLFRPGDRREARRSFGVPDDQFVVVFVGSFLETKGLSTLLGATQGLNGVSLLLVGQGPLEPKAENIAFAGTLPQSRIPLVLAAGDVFVLPTRVEGSCNAVLEAMACGLPIVTSSGRYMDDIVDASVAIRVDPVDVQAVRRAIVELMRAPERRLAMSVACLQKAGQYDIAIRAKKVTDWLDRLAMQHHRSLGPRDRRSRQSVAKRA